MELSLFLEKTVETPYATFHEESELCEACFAGNDCTLIKITYYGFCGKCATRLIGHACLFAEQGNRVRIPDTFCRRHRGRKPSAAGNSVAVIVEQIRFCESRSLAAVMT